MKVNNAKYFGSWESDLLDKISLSFILLSNIFSFNTVTVIIANVSYICQKAYFGEIVSSCLILNK